MKIEGGYRLAMRIACDFDSMGDFESLTIHLPVNKTVHTYFELILRDGSDTRFRRPMIGVVPDRRRRYHELNLPANRPSTFVVDVRQDGNGRIDVAATVNGKKVCQWDGAIEDLICSFYYHRNKGDRHAGLTFTRFAAAVHEARLIMLDGEATLDRP